MTDHLHPEPPGDDEAVDLFAVGADDRLLDDLGQDLPGDPDRDDDAALFLSTWRASLLPHDLPAPPPAPVVERPRRRAVPMFAAAAAIVALLLGTAAIGSRGAGPDDMLWPLTQLLWPDRIESVAAAEQAGVALDRARIALADGEPPQASVVLTAAAVDISKVQPRDGRADLDQDYEELWTALQGAMAAPPAGEATTSGTPSTTTRTTDSTRSSSSTGTSESSVVTTAPGSSSSGSTRPSTPPTPPSSAEPSTTPPTTTPASPDTTPPTTSEPASTSETTTTTESPLTSAEPTSSDPQTSAPEPPAVESPSGQDQLQSGSDQLLLSPQEEVVAEAPAPATEN